VAETKTPTCNNRCNDSSSVTMNVIIAHGVTELVWI
jgi:hypothetical protein